MTVWKMNPDLSAPLTHEEFVSLRDCAKGLMHRTIPAEHKDRLIQLGACPNSRCSILSESDSSLSYEQVFSPLEYRSDTAAAAECAGLRAERPCLAVYR